MVGSRLCIRGPATAEWQLVDGALLVEEPVDSSNEVALRRPIRTARRMAASKLSHGTRTYRRRSNIRLLSRYSSFIFIAVAVAFGIFLIWQITNSSLATRLFNNTQDITVTGTNGSGAVEPRQFELVTLLGFDAIRSIEDPVFFDQDRADEFYSSDELVLGIDIDGDTRAYSVPLLSRHEVVNDVVGGKPVAVTW